MPKEKAGEILAKKTADILNNPPRYNAQGQKISENITYSEAFSIACFENAELTKEYQKEIGGD